MQILPKINKASRYISGLVSVGRSKYGLVYSYFPEVLKHKRDYDSLLLSEHDVGEMFKIFSGCDTSKDDRVEIYKLLDYINVGKSRFVKKLFSSLDYQHSGNFSCCRL